jgi:transcriptional regulator with XRE-family HTH domain
LVRPMVDEDLPTRLERLIRERGLTPRGLSIKAGLSPGTVNAFIRRWKTGEQQNLTTDTAEKLARELGIPMEQFFGASAVSAEVSFAKLVRWAHETPAIAAVLLLHGDDVSVGDLLRFRAAPSSQGEYGADEAWAHMRALRRGLDTGADVTEEEEKLVGPRPSAKKRRRPK